MEEFGIYKILEVAGKCKDGHKIFKVQCGVCKHIFYKTKNHLNAKSCKHIRVEGTVQHYNNCWTNKDLQQIFNSIKQRCYNENNKNYRWYGSKGVKICDDWLNNPMNFEKWALENNYKKGLSIDRINSDFDYSPENCRWITQQENTRRAGKVNWITVEGLTMTGRQWSEYLGLGVNFINRQIRKFGVNVIKEMIKNFLNSKNNLS